MHEHAPMRRRSAVLWDDDDLAPPLSSYPAAQPGPDPVPPWVITDGNATDTDLGILKTGKEAEVSLVERRLGEQVNLLAAKRYRQADRRSFRDDTAYRAGRRTGNTRFDKAVEQGTRKGMVFRAQQWAAHEFSLLTTLWEAGAPVPYPVQLLAAEVMLQFIGGDDGVAAPRLAQLHPGRADAADLFDQTVEALFAMARCRLVHADLSPYNILVHDGRLVVIDLPQACDALQNPLGLDFLQRDVRNVCAFFTRHGVHTDPDELYGLLVAEVVR